MLERGKKLIGIGLVTAGAALVVSSVALVFLLAVQGVALNIDLWQKQWERLGVHYETRMTQEDLVRAGRALISYFKGDIRSPQMTVVIDGRERALYGSKEIQHLADVKELYRKGIFLRNVLYAVVPSLAGLTFALWRVSDRALQPQAGSFTRFSATTSVTFSAVLDSFKSFVRFYLARIALIAGISVLALALFLAVPAVVDFSSWWTGFHRISFSNDLWLLDPSTEWLIKMFPLEFFFAIVTSFWRRAVLGGLLLTVTGSLGTGALGRTFISLSSKLLHRRPQS